MKKTEQAAKFYAQGKIAGWNACGQSVRVLIHKTWWPLTVRLAAQLGT